jgi:hypothetical protein
VLSDWQTTQHRPRVSLAKAASRGEASRAVWRLGLHGIGARRRGRGLVIRRDDFERARLVLVRGGFVGRWAPPPDQQGSVSVDWRLLLFVGGAALSTAGIALLLDDIRIFLAVVAEIATGLTMRGTSLFGSGDG